MKQGTLAEHTLANSVLNNITAPDKDSVVSKIGNDFSKCCKQITADGFGSSPSVAFHKALNNFMCSLGCPTGIRILMLLPTSVKQSKIQEWMAEFNSLTGIHSISILGGHTEVSPDVSVPKFYVSVFGVETDICPNKKTVKEGHDIVMAGYTGILGTNLLIEREYEYLKDRLPAPYIDNAVFAKDKYTVSEYVSLLVSDNMHSDDSIAYLHDISAGGVYSALWQLGVCLNKGFEINNKSIPIKQETIEICEQFDINPYLIDGTGSLLIVCKNGQRITDFLNSSGIEAACIGKITGQKERLVKLSPTDIRTLSPVDGDDIYNLKKRC